MVRRSDESPLEDAAIYLQLMRQGDMKDSTGEVFYYEEFDEAVHNSGMERNAAYAALGTDAQEIEGYHFAHTVDMVKNTLAETRDKIAANAHLGGAYLYFMDVHDFVSRNEFGIQPKEAMAAIGLEEEEYKSMLDHFGSLMNTLDEAREEAKDQIRREYPFDENGLGLN